MVSTNNNGRRWISRDPSGEDAGINLYDYVQNRPIFATDALGLCDCCPKEIADEAIDIKKQARDEIKALQNAGVPHWGSTKPGATDHSDEIESDPAPL